MVSQGLRDTPYLRKACLPYGFTLVELIVVIAILGILAAVLIPKFTGFQDKARSTQVITDAKNIATAIDSLIAESTSGTITTVSDATDADDPAVKLSGVDVSRLASFSYEADGGFTLRETINSVTYTASRAATGDAPTVTP